MSPPSHRATLPVGLILALWLLGIDPAAENSGGRATAWAQIDNNPLGKPFVVVPALDFQVRAFTAKPYNFVGRSRYCDGNFCRFVHSLRVPHRSNVVAMELDACDGDTINSFRVSLTSYPINESGIGDELLFIDTAATDDGSCQFFLKLAQVPVSIDQLSRMHIIQVSAYQWQAGITAPGDTLRFQAVRVFYAPGDGVVVPTAGTE